MHEILLENISIQFSALPTNEINLVIYDLRTSLVAQAVNSLSAMQETQVQLLGWEDPLEKEMTTHSSILVWEVPRQRSLAGYSPWVCKESGHD